MNQDSNIRRGRGGRATVWLACGAAVVAALGGGVAGAAAHPADRTAGSPPYLVAWQTTDHRYCVGLAWSAQTLGAPFTGPSSCLDDPSQSSLAVGRRGLAEIGVAMWGGNRPWLAPGDKNVTSAVLGFVRGATRITAEWDGRPAAVELVPLLGSTDPEVAALVVKSDPSPRSRPHTYRIVAYDAAGAEIGRVEAVNDPV